MNNQFALSNQQLLDIARNLQQKIETGLRKDSTEIKCLPTYIHPKKDGISGEAAVFDLGGTNFRAAVVSVNEKTKITCMAEKNITEMKTIGFSEEDLYQSQAQTIKQLSLPENSSIGYCFSYPTKSLTNGDAELINWTKGVNIAGMAGKPIGVPLVEYLNKNTGSNFDKIRQNCCRERHHHQPFRRIDEPRLRCLHWTDCWYRNQYGNVLSFRIYSKNNRLKSLVGRNSGESRNW